MRELNLPPQFLNRMKQLLGEEYDSFLASFREGRNNALRVNRLKISPERFAKEAPFPVKPVPWTDNGFYVDYRDHPGQHPWYRAGVYYLQEPSAMVPARILPVEPGNRVLDLCAAPGGKATELGARLGGKGILVANEISAARARALERNIELSGIINCVVTNEDHGRLSERFRGYFDRVLVDAPCSGEGMFRKDPDAAEAWTPEKPGACAAIQREILLRASDMLRPGGYLVYSTCTFEPVENELVIAHLLQERPDMELLEIPLTDGMESFSKAYSLETLARRGFGSPETSAPRAEERNLRACEKQTGQSRSKEAGQDLTKAVRIWPHRSGGEGHFTALLKKKGSSSEREEKGVYVIPGKTGDGLLQGEKKSRRGKRRAEKGKGMTGGEEILLIREFLDAYAPDLKFDMNRCEVRNSRVYLMPEDCPDIRGLRFLRAGLYLGELKKNRFEPSQELALALAPNGYLRDDGIHVSIPSTDGRLGAFLRGEAIRPENPGKSGWRLVCADHWPVGWGKMAGGVLKNHIPEPWRSRQAAPAAAAARREIPIPGQDR